MEEFTQLFGTLLAFVYHCFDRIVIHRYLSGLSRPEQVVYFFRQVLDRPVVSKEVLSQRTRDYQDCVEAYARNHHIPIEWAEKGVRKEDYVSSRVRRLVKKNDYGVYFMFKSMEQGRTFRIRSRNIPPRTPTTASWRTNAAVSPITTSTSGMRCWARWCCEWPPSFPFHVTYWLNGHSFIEQELQRTHIGFHKNDNAFLAVDDVAALQAAADRLSPQLIRKQLDYWTFLLGPKFSKKERAQMNLSRFYALAQATFPFTRSSSAAAKSAWWRLTANRISEIFGVRLNKRLRGKLATVLDQIEQGHHVYRAYWKNAFLKQYEKFSRFLRNELCSNNLRDFGLKKGLDHLDAVRTRFQTITDRFASFQAQCLNVHVDFPLLQRLALPITGLGPLSRNQDPRHPHYPLTGSSPPWRQYRRGLDRQTNPPGCPHHLSAFAQDLRAESAPLRFA
jgi:hypothetical protein